MKKIPLANTAIVTLVDDQDYGMLVKYKWHRARGANTLYAARTGSKNETSGRSKVLMHRQILDPNYLEQCDIDHINRNGLDNRRSNLRFATRSENMLNRTPFKKKTKTRIPVNQPKRKIEIKKILFSRGITPAEIAGYVRVCSSTVYRHINGIHHSAKVEEYLRIILGKRYSAAKRRSVPGGFLKGRIFPHGTTASGSQKKTAGSPYPDKGEEL